MAILDKKTNTLISYYEVLNLTQDTSDEEVKRAFAAMAHRYHPDHNPQNRRLAELRFKLIHDAYEQIATREKRAIYNRKLRLRMAENDNVSPSSSGSLTSQIASLLFPDRTSSKGAQQ